MPPRSRESDDEDGDTNGPVKKTGLNCAECRRLKVKCDRQIPCRGCVKRGCPELCPNETLGGVKGLLQERQNLNQRIKDLENALHNAQLAAMRNGLPQRSTFPPMFDTSPSNAQGQLLSEISDLSGHEMYPLIQHEIDREVDLSDNQGTLVQIPGGQYKFIGPSAESQMLREVSLGGGHNAAWADS